MIVYDVIEEMNFFDIEGLTESSIQFSLFYSAFSRNEFREFVALPDELALIRDNINRDKLEILTRIFCKKQKGGSTIIKNPQNLPFLSEIIQNNEAFQVLLESNDLTLAYDLLADDNSHLFKLLSSVDSLLKTAEETLKAADVGVDQKCIHMMDGILEKVNGLNNKLQKLAGLNNGES